MTTVKYIYIDKTQDHHHLWMELNALTHSWTCFSVLQSSVNYIVNDVKLLMKTENSLKQKFTIPANKQPAASIPSQHPMNSESFRAVCNVTANQRRRSKLVCIVKCFECSSPHSTVTIPISSFHYCRNSNVELCTHYIDGRLLLYSPSTSSPRRLPSSSVSVRF